MPVTEGGVRRGAITTCHSKHACTMAARQGRIEIGSVCCWGTSCQGLQTWLQEWLTCWKLVMPDSVGMRVGLPSMQFIALAVGLCEAIAIKCMHMVCNMDRQAATLPSPGFQMSMQFQAAGLGHRRYCL